MARREFQVDDHIEIIQYPVLKDNYNYIIHDAVAEVTAVVDPSVGEPALAILQSKGWQLDYIFNTHHHDDHVGGNLMLKEETGCEIIGFEGDAARIPGIDIMLEDGDIFMFGGVDFDIMLLPGHTTGHIAYWCEKINVLFSGDVMFAMGCGRLFEGTPEQQFKSLEKLAALPDTTNVYCAHEYTQKNGEFALQYDKGNQDLRARMEEVKSLRESGIATVPTTIGLERKTNPFLRTHVPAMAKELGMQGSPAKDVFTELRKRRNEF